MRFDSSIEKYYIDEAGNKMAPIEGTHTLTMTFRDEGNIRDQKYLKNNYDRTFKCRCKSY